jgi:hypothetical protein
MSEDREKKAGRYENDEAATDTDDVNAHRKQGRWVNDEGTDVEPSGDDTADVEAHRKQGRWSNDEGGDDTGNEVEGHVKIK